MSRVINGLPKILKTSANESKKLNKVLYMGLNGGEGSLPILKFIFVTESIRIYHFLERFSPFAFHIMSG